MNGQSLIKTCRILFWISLENRHAGLIGLFWASFWFIGVRQYCFLSNENLYSMYFVIFIKRDNNDQRK